MHGFAEIRRRLETQRDDLADRVRRIHADRRKVNGPLSADFAEQAVELENEEVLTRLDAAGRRELRMIMAALARIDAGVYGACVECEDEIPTARLEALPFALRCIACAEETGLS